MGKIVWLMAALLLAGCSGAPGEGTLEQLVAQQLYRNGGDQIYRIDHFEKLSGYEKKDGSYVADVEYDLVFRKSYKEVAEELKKRSQDNPLGVLGEGVNLFALKLQYGDFQEGEAIHQEERLTLVKTDQGWILEKRE